MLFNFLITIILIRKKIIHKKLECNIIFKIRIMILSILYGGGSLIFMFCPSSLKNISKTNYVRLKYVWFCLTVLKYIILLTVRKIVDLMNIADKIETWLL